MFYYEKDMKIMTWNIYLGASLEPLNNTTKEEVPIAVTEIFNQVIETDFTERARSIARIIKDEEPELIGLQEVAEWTVKSYDSECRINFLAILLKELCKNNIHYRAVAINRNYSWSFPDIEGNIISLLNRDVILVRCDLEVEITKTQESNYNDNLVTIIGGKPFTFTRGYSFVDIRICDKKIRLVNTRLEATEDANEIRFKQTKQLIKETVNTSLPIILLGSFSIEESGPIYDIYIKEDFIDSWKVRGKGPGYTAFQASDLMNRESSLSERFEYIFYKDNFKVFDITTVGDKRRDKTCSGLWPSDHAGIVGEFDFPTWA